MTPGLGGAQASARKSGGTDDALAGCMAADVPALREALERAGDPGRLPRAQRERLEASRARAEQRRQSRPPIRFPEELPVSARRSEIAAAISAHQAVVVCGETGSGKTTQLPKICLDLGRGATGLIGHTQPRRIAARATAARVSQELGSELGRVAGYKIRFTDRTSPQSYIKLMTDGILLAETQGDPELRAYDTLIIDEAHERSLNIDFLLGFVRQLLPRRPELKVIVTSATLDAGRFAAHFAEDGRPAPVIEVSGRLFPIEIRHRPWEGREDADLMDALVDAVDEARAMGPGDVLAFLPGEREIREAAEALRKHQFGRPRAGVTAEILPLFARQSAQEQQQVFAPSTGRRIVLATNVAETSLTVPGVRYVVDTGLARVKRYSHRNKVEQLLVEPISQAAAKQRAGRCGRVVAGVCFRLYAEDDLERRPLYGDPEILRASLAGVILRMSALGLGAVEEFPFIDRPLPRMIADGYQQLAELGAIDERRVLTPIGRSLARLPVDPKIGRMILAARDEGCLREVLVIAAALSVQDPRERPAERAGSADQAHARWKDERSEFLAFLKLWERFDEVWAHQSQRKQREWCRENFLSWLRMREWRDVHGQLHALAAEHGWKESAEPASYEAIHRALLAGLLGNAGVRTEEGDQYLGARGIKFHPHPGSALAKKAGKWIMAAELVETSRLFARCIARIEPQWLESVGAHLVRRHVFDPHWEKSRGEVMAFERATVHGLVIHARRPVAYRRVDPAKCREIFIREALVAGDFDSRAPFFQHNRRLVEEIEQLEHRARRPDVLVDEALIEAFYDRLIPQQVCDQRSFEAWRREAEVGSPRLLFLERDQLMRHEAAGVTSERFPPRFDLHGQALALSYRFEPGASDDGVTLTVPVAMLNQVPAGRCEWVVPGLLEEKVRQLARTLPQKVRHRLGPLEAFAAEFCAGAHDAEEPLLKALRGAVAEHAQLPVPPEAFRGENLPAHLTMNFRVIDAHGRVLGQSRNLAELRAQLAPQAERSFAQAQPGDGRLSGLTGWSFGDLPEIMELEVGGHAVIGFPGLQDDGDSVSVRVFDTPEKARAAHRLGLRRLFALALAEPLRYVERNLPGLRETALRYLAHGSESELKAHIAAAALERTCMAEPWPSDERGFLERRELARPRVALVAQEIARLVGAVLADAAAVEKRLAQLKAFPAVEQDLRAQLCGLLPKGFVASVPFERLQHYPRYLKAIQLRLDKLREDPARDARIAGELAALQRPWERERARLAQAGHEDARLDEYRWLLEELRVSLFAQQLRTPVPVSVKRLQKIWESRKAE